MSTYRYKCRCGVAGPYFPSRQESRTWFARHKETCAGRASSTAAASSAAFEVAAVGRARPVDAELAELQARAHRCKPIPLPSSEATWTASTEWVDTAHSDPWGAPPHGPQLLNRTWSRGNCLKACIASLLGAPIDRVPDPVSEFHTLDGWLERYKTRLTKETGYRLHTLPASSCPPRNPNQLWIACISMPGPADHVVVARGHYVIHDPLGEFMGLLPLDRLIDGMIVTPARRVLPVFSPHRGGVMVVPA